MTKKGKQTDFVVVQHCPSTAASPQGAQCPPPPASPDTSPAPVAATPIAYQQKMAAPAAPTHHRHDHQDDHHPPAPPPRRKAVLLNDIKAAQKARKAPHSLPRASGIPAHHLPYVPYYAKIIRYDGPCDGLMGGGGSGICWPTIG
ncbi:unnamed protein product [Vitrella brassicaformis CCMP3155]|uniref:Uncharacterized protein n=1 Tax=Vitrella brassicaformis (strain CCMP3155) TaxID=1169540 RepID=A0A0G4H3E9_VITBC|nr:unnamed protein product [Vitrella brassicaformis CCMP3155]|eukprot:CEM38144.1 unnamed protein product [Vitrella brassicaformis CCMP3155]